MPIPPVYYPGSPTSGPRERIIGVSCHLCWIVEATTECDRCCDSFCAECIVVCDRCGEGDPLCIPCAIRSRLLRINDEWLCENCAPEEEIAEIRRIWREEQLVDEMEMLAELDAERAAHAETQKKLNQIRTLPGTYVCCMSGHYYAETRGDEECPICERLNRLRAVSKALAEALNKIRRTPTMPFPDRGAHSERAFSNAVWTAWSRIQQIADAALALYEKESK